MCAILTSPDPRNDAPFAVQEMLITRCADLWVLEARKSRLKLLKREEVSYRTAPATGPNAAVGDKRTTVHRSPPSSSLRVLKQRPPPRNSTKNNAEWIAKPSRVSAGILGWSGLRAHAFRTGNSEPAFRILVEVCGRSKGVLARMIVGESIVVGFGY